MILLIIHLPHVARCKSEGTNLRAGGRVICARPMAALGGGVLAWALEPDPSDESVSPAVSPSVNSPVVTVL